VLLVNTYAGATDAVAAYDALVTEPNNVCAVNEYDAVAAYDALTTEPNNI
jgi:hypothetical protein